MINHTYIHKNLFQFESGEILSELTINYCTLGKLNKDKSNVIWICHALTANADASGWWSGLVGDGKFFNPQDHFIICANILGSCYGSSGPLSQNPATQLPYFFKFPQPTIRDMVKAHELLRLHLGIQHIDTCIGGSLGGQQAMEWAIMNPPLINHLILLATNAVHSPWGVAFNEAQRMAIKADPTWKDANENAGREGLKAARAVALLSYRNYFTYKNSQLETDLNKIDNFKASSYQNYQGEKLVNRFNCHSYILLSKAMDSHNVGRGRSSINQALQTIKSKSLLIGITGDLLFPVDEQLYLKENIPNSSYNEIESIFGHDGFLIETVKIEKIIKSFYDTIQV